LKRPLEWRANFGREPVLTNRQQAEARIDWRQVNRPIHRPGLQGAPQYGGTFATPVNSEPPLAIRTRTYLGPGTIGDEPAAAFLDRPPASA